MSMNARVAAAMARALEAQEKAAHGTTHSAPEPVTPPQLTIVEQPTVTQSQPVALEEAPVVRTNAPQPKRTVDDILAKVQSMQAALVKVRMSRSMFGVYKKDKEATDEYGAGNVSKHLFTGAQNRVKQTNAKYNEVYRFWTEKTTPTGEPGVRVLNTKNMPVHQFMKEWGALNDAAEKAADDLEAHWDEEVQADLVRLHQIAMAKGKPSLVNPDDYPSTVRDRYESTLRLLPVPSEEHFSFELTQEMKDELRQEVLDLEQQATDHVIKSLVEPMNAALEKLKEYKGEKGQRFHDSTITNLVEVAERMNAVNLSDDPVLQGSIDALRNFTKTVTPEVAKESQAVRDQAAKELDRLMEQMKGLA